MRRDRLHEAERELAQALPYAQTRDELWAIYYQRARIAARAGDPARAIAALEIAVDLGRFTAKYRIRHEDDFASLRDLPELLRILA